MFVGSGMPRTSRLPGGFPWLADTTPKMEPRAAGMMAWPACMHITIGREEGAGANVCMRRGIHSATTLAPEDGVSNSRKGFGLRCTRDTSSYLEGRRNECHKGRCHISTCVRLRQLEDGRSQTHAMDCDAALHWRVILRWVWFP